MKNSVLLTKKVDGKKVALSIMAFESAEYCDMSEHGGESTVVSYSLGDDGYEMEVLETVEQVNHLMNEE